MDSFLGEERKKPQSIATNSQVGNKPNDYTGPTVAELDADVKAGKAISLTDLAKAVNAENQSKNTRNGVPKSKPTLMERLEECKRRAGQHGQQPPKNKEARE